MNYYAVLFFFILGIVMLSVELGWLGLIFIFLGVVSAFFDPAKKGMKNAWGEVNKAESTYPEGKLMEYGKESSKKVAEVITPERDKKLDPNFVHNMVPASKSFVKEFKELFK